MTNCTFDLRIYSSQFSVKVTLTKHQDITLSKKSSELQPQNLIDKIINGSMNQSMNLIF